MSQRTIRPQILTAAVIALAAAGCPSVSSLPDGAVGAGLATADACTRVPELAEEAQRKLGECTNLMTAGEHLPEISVASCERRWPSCTSVDREELDLFVGCLRELPACTLDTLGTFRMKAGLCTPRLTRVTSGCIRALSAVP